MGGKKIANVVVYGLFRGHGSHGVAVFSEFYLGPPPATVQPMAFVKGAATPTSHPGDTSSNISVASTLAPPGWKGETLELGAVFTGHSNHIRCDGSIAVTPAPGKAMSTVSDKAVSLQFSMPLDARGE